MLQTAINLKKINTTNIFQQFLDNEALTKQDLVASLGLTLPTINKNIDYLMDKGLICATGSRGKTGGRNAITYAVVADAQIALGLDVTRHHVCIVADDLEGFFAELRKGKNPDVTALWNDYLDHLAAVVKNVNVLLDCDVVIGGYVGAYMEPYIEGLRARVAKLGTFDQTGDYIRLCSYKKESIAAGAALHFIAESINTI